MTMTYDYVDGPLPAGWREVKNIWFVEPSLQTFRACRADTSCNRFDVNECGTSEVNPLKQSGKYTIQSKPWTPNFEGEILGVGGHLHDGSESPTPSLIVYTDIVARWRRYPSPSLWSGQLRFQGRLWREARIYFQEDDNGCCRGYG